MRVIDVDSHYFEPPDWLASVDPKLAAELPAEDTIERSGGMQIGGVTPFGLPEDLPIWIDERVMARERVIVGGGGRDRKVLCPPATIAALAAAEVVADLAKEPPPA